MILSFNEISVILKQVSSYPNIYNVHWWGSDGTAKSQRAMDDAPDEANHIGIYSLLSRETLTPLYNNLESRYVALTKQQYGTYQRILLRHRDGDDQLDVPDTEHLGCCTSPTTEAHRRPDIRCSRLLPP